MDTFHLTNPSTGATEDTFTRIGDADRDRILDTATASYRSWRTATVEQRAAVLARTADLYEQRRDELAAYIGREMGKRFAEGRAEVTLTASIYRWYAEHAHELLAVRELPTQKALHTYVRKDPVGPLLGIMPWNFPYYQVARWAAPNLLLGNSLVLKHASLCPLSSQACQDILEDAGLPEGVFQNIYAAGSQMDAFVADPRIAAVSLTGSEAAGAAVAKTAGEHFKKSLLELGGNAPFIILGGLSGTDLDRVLDRYVDIRMYNTGQACNAPKRLIVLDEDYDRVLSGLEERIGALTLGAWDDPDADVGPLSSVEARDGIVERIGAAVGDGSATVRRGGGAVDRPGAFMTPTLLTDVDPSADIGCNEIFGPVAVIYRASDVDDAVRIANNSDYGLSGSVWGTDLALAEDVASRLEVGMSFVNDASVTAAGLPFGGVGRSGYGRELGKWGVGEFSNDHLVRVRELRR